MKFILTTTIFIILSNNLIGQINTYTAPDVDIENLKMTEVDRFKSALFAKGIQSRPDVQVETINPENSVFVEATLEVGTQNTSSSNVGTNGVNHTPSIESTSYTDETSVEVIERIDDESEGLRVSTTSVGNDGSDGKVKFDYDSYSLGFSAKETLNEFAQLIKENSPDIILIVEGHTDDRGSIEYNKQLSINRANSVVNYLVSQGLNSNNITLIGMGELDPKYPNSTETYRGMNRRVEFEFYNPKN